MIVYNIISILGYFANNVIGKYNIRAKNRGIALIISNEYFQCSQPRHGAQADLSMCDLSMYDLNMCDLSMCDLSMCDLSMCDLSMFDLSMCNLSMLCV